MIVYKMVKFKSKSKFINLETVSLRLTKKEFMKGEKRFKDYEDRTDVLFKRLRSKEQKEKLPKFDMSKMDMMEN